MVDTIVFPLAPALCSIDSAADFAALFVDFLARTAGSDFSLPCIIGYGSSHSRCGPTPVYGRERLSLREMAFDHGGAAPSCITMALMLPSLIYE